MEEKDRAEGEDNFKPVFKLFKRRKPPPPSPSEVDVSFSLHFKPLEFSNSGVEALPASDLGLRQDPSSWEAFSGPRGLVLVRDPFTEEGKLRWADRCLRSYSSCPPNRTNLGEEGTGRWRKEVGIDENGGRPASASASKKVVNGLRWATLGYHHDWDTKVYREDNVTEFPQVSRVDRLLAWKKLMSMYV